ncbi:MAG: glutathione S-transferase N-terminal domain-containing protein [Rhodospirillales bacterium]
MQLSYSPTSPYVRKCHATILHHGLEARFDLVSAAPTDEASGYRAINPFSKVPALILEDGTVLVESPVIADFIDHLGEGEKLFPVEPKARVAALRLLGYGDNLTDIAVAMMQEGKRKDCEQSAYWLERWQRGIDAGLDRLDREADDWAGRLDIGLISIGAALGYLDFRFPGTDWRAEHPALADWFETFGERPVMARTQPQSPA